MPVDKSGERVRRMFGEIAPRYDLLNHLLSLNVDRYWRWRTVRILQPQAGLPILDVCTGTGDLAFAFWRRTRGQVSIVAADFCPEMLEIGERKKRRASPDCPISFQQADTQDLPFEDNRFQIVAVAFGLRNVADTRRGLQEMVRVCAPGGRVAILEFAQPRWTPFRQIYGWYFRTLLPRIGQWVARNQEQAYHYLPASVREFPSGAALAELLQAVGLTDVRNYPFTCGIAALSVGVKRTVSEPEEPGSGDAQR